MRVSKILVHSFLILLEAKWFDEIFSLYIPLLENKLVDKNTTKIKILSWHTNTHAENSVEKFEHQFHTHLENKRWIVHTSKLNFMSEQILSVHTETSKFVK